MAEELSEKHLESISNDGRLSVEQIDAPNSNVLDADDEGPEETNFSNEESSTAGTALLSDSEAEPPFAENYLPDLVRQVSETFPYCDFCAGLLSQIPEKFPSPFARKEHLKVTAVDASDSLIVLGTGNGNLFLFNRGLEKVARLRGNGEVSKIKCKCVNETQLECLEYDHVAVGQKSGMLVFLRLPSSEPGKSRKLHQRSLAELHKAEITCLEWSNDGTKLFSGDMAGLVMMTLVAFDNDAFHPSFICCEDAGIVQLSFKEGLLAVSSLRRAVVVDVARDCALTQIGTAGRKIFAEFGVQFHPDPPKEYQQVSQPQPPGTSEEEAENIIPESTLEIEGLNDSATNLPRPEPPGRLPRHVLTTRPGCRLWVADGATGIVSETLMYRDLIEAAPDLPLPQNMPRNATYLTDMSGPMPANVTREFGHLYFLSPTLLVTYSTMSVYILIPSCQRIVAKMDLRKPIRDLAVCQARQEILVIVGERGLLRISTTSPESSIVTPTESSGREFGSNRAKESILSRLRSAQSVMKQAANNVKAPTSGFSMPLGASCLFGDSNSDSMSLSSSTDNQPGFFRPEGGSRSSTPDTLSVATESSTADQKAFLEEEERGNEQGGKVTVTVRKIQQGGMSGAEQRSGHGDEGKERSWSDAMRETTVILSLGGVGSSVETGDFPALSAPFPVIAPSDYKREHINGTSRMIGHRETEDVKVTHFRKVLPGSERKKKGNKGNSLENQKDDDEISEEEEIFDCASSSNAIVHENGVQTDTEFPVTREDMEAFLDSALKVRATFSSESDENPTESLPEGRPERELENGVVIEGGEATNEEITETREVGSGFGDFGKNLEEEEEEKRRKRSEEDREFLNGFKTPENPITLSMELSVKSGEKIKSTVLESLVVDYRGLEDSMAGSNADYEEYRRLSRLRAEEANGDPDIYPRPMDDLTEEPLGRQRDDSSLINGSFESDTGVFLERFIAEIGLPSTNGNVAVQLDIWNQFAVEARAVCVAAPMNYVAYVDGKQGVQFANLGNPDFCWDTIPEKADQISISDNGHLVWRLENGIAYGLLKPSSLGPKGHRWVEAARGDVICVAVSRETAWYLKKPGQVYAQLELSGDRPCYKVTKVGCDWPLVSLACIDEAAWGLRDDGRLVVRVGMTRQNLLGDDWVDVFPDGPSELVSISLCRSTGWAVDVNGRLWFTTGVSFKHPFGRTGRWWQVMVPSQSETSSNIWGCLLTPYQQLPDVYCTAGGVWLGCGQTVYYSRGAVSGHRWKHGIPSRFAAFDSFKKMAVGGMFETDKDFVWLLRTNEKEFFAFQPKSRKLTSVPNCPTDAKPVCLASTLSVLWVLDNKGRIFIRSGIDPKHSPLGKQWEKLDMTQLDVQLIHLTCTLDAVWALDKTGGVWVRLGTSSSIAGGLSSAWVPLDTPKGISTHQLREIHSSSDGSLVWAMSDGGRVWSRYGITESMPIGSAWTEVEGMECKRVAVGSEVVWALDASGQLYRRHGVRLENPSGNYWKKLPATLRHIAVTPVNRLWGLDETRRLVKHQVKIYWPPEQSNQSEANRQSSTSITEAELSFELV